MSAHELLPFVGWALPTGRRRWGSRAHRGRCPPYEIGPWQRCAQKKEGRGTDPTRRPTRRIRTRGLRLTPGNPAPRRASVAVNQAPLPGEVRYPSPLQDKQVQKGCQLLRAAPRRLETMMTFRILTRAARQWIANNDARLGAALAYYTLFSIAPLLILAIHIAGVIYGE